MIMKETQSLCIGQSIYPCKKTVKKIRLAWQKIAYNLDMRQVDHIIVFLMLNSDFQYPSPASL